MVVGKLNFADNQISITGKLYADLSKVASGSVTVLFLANIPDQVQLLTIDGCPEHGLRERQRPGGHVPDDAPALHAPSGVLVGPRS